MDYLLVHGTTQSSAGWQPLVAALSARGHRAVAVNLPTDEPSFLAADYADRARADAGAPLTDPVVVAHSGSGLLLPALAQSVQARHLVWLAAAVPDWTRGRSFADEVTAAGGEIFSQEWLDLTEPPTDDPVLAAYFLFHDCDLATLQWALTTVQLFYPRAVYTEPPPPPPDVPSTYVLPQAERVLTPGWMRTAARQRLGIDPVNVPGGHCPHVSHPEAVADILAAAGQHPG